MCVCVCFKRGREGRSLLINIIYNVQCIIIYVHVFACACEIPITSHAIIQYVHNVHVYVHVPLVALHPAWTLDLSLKLGSKTVRI